MFFREKKTNTSKHPVIQLVENYRIGHKVKQRIIISLGTEIDLPKNIRAKVAKAIEDKLLGIQPIWNDPKVNHLTETIVRQIQSQGKWSSLRNANHSQAEQSAGMPTAQVYVDDVDHSFSRELGPCLIGHTFWQRLGFEEILQSCGFNSEQIRTCEISVLNRLISGDNELNIPSWIQTTAIGDLLGSETERYGKDRFYRISDKLLSEKETIEKQLYAKETAFFDCCNTLVLYDLTNSYFEGACADNPKAQYNKNQKEKRTDCPQIVIALVLDGEGFCRRHFTFQGKMSDSRSLSEVLQHFKQEFDNQEKPTVIIDRGIACDENIELIENQYGLNYIVAARNNEEDEFAEIFKNEDFEILKADKNNQVEVRIEKQEHAHYLLCKSSGRLRKEKAMRTRKEQKLEEQLTKLSHRIATAKINSPEDVNIAIGRLRERHNKVAHYYEIDYHPYRFQYVIKDTKKVSQRLQKMLLVRKEKALTFKITYLALQKNIADLKEKYKKEFEHIETKITEPELTWNIIEEKEKAKQALEGNYVLKTNRKDMTNAAIWNTYVMLTRVEKAFRNLKTDLALRPNPHHKEFRVDGHVFISILAYHLLHAIEFTLRQKGMNVWWCSIKRVMKSHQYATIIIPTVEGTVIHSRKPGVVEQIHKQIYDLLNIDYQNLKKTKIYV